MPRIAVYAATKFAVKGLTEALSVEWQRHGVRVSDVLPGLIDTPILTATPNHSGDRPSVSQDELRANAPKKGMFRLLPATSVAEAAWKAYGSDRLHWYVPEGLRWIERIKALSPEAMRKRVMKSFPMLGPEG
jgi:NAD(P)-dependent dehydrogenase (short-subunit alcohol dehydrogenase family)